MLKQTNKDSQARQNNNSLPLKQGQRPFIPP